MLIDRFISQPENFQNQQGEFAGKTGERIDWVDIAKGICIILVVMMHATLGVQIAVQQTGYMDFAIAFAKPFRMPDFFLLSGLFLAATINRPWALYLDRKVVHFAYFYVLWFVFQAVLKAPFMLKDLGAMGTIGALGWEFINPSLTLWFIYLLPILFLIARATRHLNAHLVFLLAAILSILPIHTGLVVIDETAQFFVYFYAGFAYAPLVFSIASASIEKTKLVGAMLLIWALMNAFLVFGFGPENWINGAAEAPIHLPIISLVFGFLGALAIIAFSAILSVRKNIVSNFLRHAGENSIAIYLSFFFPMAVMRILLVKFAPWLGAGNISLIVLAVAVLAPLVLLAFIKRLDFGHFLFKRPKWAVLATKNDISS